jgi:hypothetical protein
MELALTILRFLHFIGLGLLLGALAVQWGEMSRQVGPLMITGAIIQLVTGLALMGLLISEINHIKVGVKLILLLVILIVLLLRRRNVFSPPFYLTALGLTVVNIGLAVFW